jgi:hypothetical protein
VQSEKRAKDVKQRKELEKVDNMRKKAETDIKIMEIRLRDQEHRVKAMDIRKEGDREHNQGT